MLRFEITERDRGGLPAIDVADDVIVIGSAPSARVRLPGEAARPEHARVGRDGWALLADAVVDGAPRRAGDRGPLGDGVVLELDRYRVRVSRAPDGAQAASRQRTESLARELVRSLLGEGAAPTLAIERGSHAGARRSLPPPEASVVIGRGDEAGWVIVDEDLSRLHAAVRRGWDGVTVADLGSKNGTWVDGARISGEPVALHDGAELALGALVMRFRDPAERHLRGEPGGAAADGPEADRVGGGAEALGTRAAPAAHARGAAGSQREPRPGATGAAPAFYAYVAIAALALAALAWVLAS